VGRTRREDLRVRLDPYVEGLAKRLEEIEPAEAVEAGS
jgi:hypothetical protein